jgi:hypothetical protein
MHPLSAHAAPTAATVAACAHSRALRLAARASAVGVAAAATYVLKDGHAADPCPAASATARPTPAAPVTVAAAHGTAAAAPVVPIDAPVLCSCCAPCRHRWCLRALPGAPCCCSWPCRGCGCGSCCPLCVLHSHAADPCPAASATARPTPAAPVTVAACTHSQPLPAAAAAPAATCVSCSHAQSHAAASPTATARPAATVPVHIPTTHGTAAAAWVVLIQPPRFSAAAPAPAVAAAAAPAATCLSSTAMQLLPAPAAWAPAPTAALHAPTPADASCRTAAAGKTSTCNQHMSHHQAGTFQTLDASSSHSNSAGQF